jgi:cell division transport system permease protein
VYQKDVVDALISWTSAIRLIGAILAGLFAVDALLIIMTVIGMKIALKREEVEILKLVGASPWYIRMPFIFEGGMYGAIGAVFAWSTLTGFLLWIRPTLSTFLGTMPAFHAVLVNPFGSLSLLLAIAFFGILSVTGFVLGSVGSLVAVGRYLKL